MEIGPHKQDCKPQDNAGYCCLRRSHGIDWSELVEMSMNSEQAKERFAEVLRRGCKLVNEVNAWDLWVEFKEYCAISIENDGEGFVFAAGFKGTFLPPDFEFVPDCSRFEVTFNRYWYDVRGGSCVTECNIEFPGHPSLSRFHPINFEVCPLQDYVDKVEAMEDLWSVIRSMKGSCSNSCAKPN